LKFSKIWYVIIPPGGRFRDKDLDPFDFRCRDIALPKDLLL